MTIPRPAWKSGAQGKAEMEQHLINASAEQRSAFAQGERSSNATSVIISNMEPGTIAQAIDELQQRRQARRKLFLVPLVVVLSLIGALFVFCLLEKSLSEYRRNIVQSNIRAQQLANRQGYEAMLKAAFTEYHVSDAADDAARDAALQMLGPLRQLNADTLAQFDEALRLVHADAGRYFVERIDIGDFEAADPASDNDDQADQADQADRDSDQRVTLPTFRDGRPGRFVHDFKSNQSLIVDADSRQCFVMALAAQLPRNMRDMYDKLNSGYYNIDMEVVRQRMHVVQPAVADRAQLGERIQNECEGLDVYRLETVAKRVVKRSTDGKNVRVGGGKLVEVDVVNYKAIDNRK